MIEHDTLCKPVEPGIRILLCTLGSVAADADAVTDANLLSADEQERAARFALARDRWSYRAAHGLLRSLLTEFHQQPPLAWTFCHNAHGRPELDPQWHGVNPPRFNISHTHDRVAVALTLDAVPPGVEVGVDVESMTRTADALGLARRFLSPREADWLHSLPADDQQSRFLCLWTLKEAVAKAVGLGLSLNLRHFHCTLEPLSVTFDDPRWGQPEEWALYNEWVAPGHWVSMAVRHPSDQPVKWEVRHDGHSVKQ